MKMPVVALIITGSLAVIPTARVPDANDETVAVRDHAAEQDLKDLELKLNKASMSGDATAVTKIVAADFIGMDGGVWDGKVQWVPQDKEVFAKDVVSASSRVADITVSDLEARVHGQTGIVRGRGVFKMKDGTVYDTHFLDTWEKRNGHWIQVAAATSSQQTH